MQILVVDDNRDNANSFTALLKLLGHEVSVAYHAKEALTLAWGRLFDVAFLDIAMPELDGYQLGVQIKKNPKCKDLLLIAMTGFTDDAHRQRAEQAGFFFFLVKPVDLEELSVVLGRCEQRPTRAEIW